jgi:predicted nucleic-acid-binding protein
MLGIDTNVVVRLVVADDAEQTRRARKLIEQAQSREEPVLVSLLVLLESEWVLRSRYGFDRQMGCRSTATFDGKAARLPGMLPV